MSKGKQLFNDFLVKSGRSFKIMQEKGTITLDELKPAWEARDKLENYLDPPRDEKGHFIKTVLNSKEASTKGGEKTDE